MREEARSGLSRTLISYFAREVVIYTLLGFVAITTVLVSQNLLRKLEDLVGVGFQWSDVGVALSGMTVMFVSYAAPVSFLFGSLVAMRRLTSDSEVLAMRACGVGLGALLVPTLAIGCIVSSLTGFLMLHSEHQARRDLRTLLITVAARGSVLQPGSFRMVGDRVVFIRERDRHNNLRGIMISAESGEKRPYLVFAERGRFDFDPELAMIRILLDSGDLHVEPDPKSPGPYQHLTFEKLSYEIDVRGLIASGYHPTRPKQMTLEELRTVRARSRSGEILWDLDDKDPIHYEIEIHRRFALPLAPLSFALLAVALGSSRPHRRRSWALLVGIVLAFAYYASISFAGLIAERGWIPPPLALWGPTSLFAILGAWLFARARAGTSV